MAGFADLFGGMFGGGGPAPTPGLLDAAGYMDPAQYDAARRSQGMMGLWAGLLQGGGPSLEPRNFGSALGAGLVGQQKFGSTFDEDQLHASQAAQARANVGKLGAESENLRASTKMLADAAAMGIGMQAPGAAPVGGAGAVPNFGAGTGGGGGGWGPHAPVAIETLKAAGYSDAAIAGIMANGLGEGGFKTNWQKAGGGENSFGHWQFNERGELPGLREFAKAQGGDPTDTRIQALYVAKRAEEVSPGFSKLTDPKLATDIFATKFERYKGAAPGQRYGLLADATRYMAGTPVEERLPIPAGPGGYGAPAPDGIPQVPSYAGAFGGGPVPAAVAGGPAAPVPGPLAGAPSGNRPGTNLPKTGAGLITAQDYEQWLASQRAPAAGNNIRVEPLSGEAVPAGAAPAGPTFGYGSAQGAISPAAQATAAAAQGAPQVPAAAVAPAPPVPTAPPPVAPAPSPAALAPAAAAAALPAPPAPAAALPLPPRPVLPERPPLPAQPALPAAPAPPPIPGAVAVPPLPAAQAPPAQGAQPYSPQAHKAQMIATALSMAGRTVPAFIAEAAGLPLAGQKAALEAAARQPFTLQGQQYGHALAMAKADWEARNKTQQDEHAARLGMTGKEFDASIKQQETDYQAGINFAQKQWDALTKNQQDEVAARNGMTADQYKKQLEIAGAKPIAAGAAEGALPSKKEEQTHKTDEELRKELDTPKPVTIYGPDGTPYTSMMTPREQRAEEARRAAAGGGAPGAVPIPGALQTGLGPQREAELKGRAERGLIYTKKVQSEAQAAIDGRADIDQALAHGPNIDWRGPGAALKQQFNRITASVLGVNTESVASYEMAQQLMGDMTRRALRASDPNPTERQQQMMLASFPTPASSPSGYVQGLRHMQGIADWKVYRQEALANWENTKGTSQGFEQGFKLSAIPFVVARMPEAERTSYYAQLYRADPKAYDRLVEQLKEIKSSNTNFQY